MKTKEELEYIIEGANRLNWFWERDTIKLAKSLEEDPDKKLRLKDCYCKRCWYRITLSGQAFTQYTCQLCDKEEMHHNTGVPNLCLPCAKKLNLCKDCMGDLSSQKQKRSL